MAAGVFAADEQGRPVDVARWVRLAEEVLGAEGVRDGELSLLFVDDASMADLNRRFLGKDGPTDVLAFPIDDELGASDEPPPDDDHRTGPRATGPGGGPGDDVPTLLGDVVVCPAVAERQAPDHAGTYDDEVALLVVHGILHLLGMDHEDDEEAAAMESREKELLERFYAPVERS